MQVNIENINDFSYTQDPRQSTGRNAVYWNPLHVQASRDVPSTNERH